MTLETSNITEALATLQRHLRDLSLCFDWLLTQQEADGGLCYPTAKERVGHLSLPLRWLAERARDELAAAEDILHDLRNHINSLSADE